MKKITILTVLTVSFFYSCTHHQDLEEFNTSSLNNQNIEIKNGVVHFNSFDAYEAFLQNEDQKQKFTVESDRIEFKSLRKSMVEVDASKRTFDHFDSTLLDAGIISDLLNEDYLIRIDDYYFKIDTRNESVYVIKGEDKTDYQNLLDGNFDNKNIQTFSTNDEVLAMLRENSSNDNNRSLGCGESGAGNGKLALKPYCVGTTNRRISYELNYVPLGIYFSLSSQVKSQTKRLGVWVQNNNQFNVIHYYTDYTVRCRGTFRYSGSIGDYGSVKFKPYEGIYSLSYYYLYSDYISCVNVYSKFIEGGN